MFTEIPNHDSYATYIADCAEFVERGIAPVVYHREMSRNGFYVAPTDAEYHAFWDERDMTEPIDQTNSY